MWGEKTAATSHDPLPPPSLKIRLVIRTEKTEKNMSQILAFLIFIFLLLYFFSIFYNECNICEIRGKIRYISTEIPLRPSESLQPSRDAMAVCLSLSKLQAP